jgi:hypothetical protein
MALPVAAVPILSPLGLVVLALALVFAAATLLRRRQRQS